MKITTLLSTVFFIATQALSADYFVDASQPDDSGGGTSWSAAKKTIQATVDLTTSGDVVWITNGVYELSQPVVVTNAIRIATGTDPSQTVVRAITKTQVFMLTGSGSTLSGLTITGGRYDNFSYLPDVTYGGGVSCDDGNHIITNCIISGNKASYGGGGVYGGTVYDSIIYNNSVAKQNGGGLHGTTAYRCVIKDNMAGSGLGGGAYGGYLENCLVVGNHGGTGGGGLSEGEAVNCTIVKNTASNSGGVDSSVVKNSIIYGNTRDFYGTHNIGGSSVFNSCSTDVSHGSNGNITNNVLFMNFDGEDYRLSPSSPCINSANNADAPTGADLDGNPRVIGGTVDMGAHEFYVDTDDFDNDGIPNEWEAQHFGSITNASKNTICSNGINTVLQAYIVGVDPNDPNSEFTTTIVSDNVLQWSCVSGRVYSVYWTTNLFDGFQPLETNIPWTCSSFTNSTDTPAAYFKLGVELEE